MVLDFWRTKMKAFLVIRRFKDGSAEGVMFTDKADADMALSGEPEDGSQLANEWCEMYGGDPMTMTEIEI